jgi:Flp pilus assembly protein TadD
MMRIVSAFVLLALAGCAGGGGAQLSSAPPGLNVAEAALSGGAPNVALQVSTERLQREPGDRHAMLVQADALAALGRRAEAEDGYRRVLALDPDSGAARLGLGRMLLASDPRGAEQSFLEALSHDPRDAKALNDLGIARDLQGRHADAQAAYRQALGVAPEMQAAIANLALSLALGGQAAQGAALLRPLAGAPNASPRVRQDMAAVSELAGDRPGAVRMLGQDMSPDQVQDTLRGYDALSLSPPPASAGAR